VYNTWAPFRKDINEKLIMEVTDAAVACGVKEFVIDDGWQNNRGDWEVDRGKFPHGLKPVFDYIKSKGMKPGLWISLCAVSIDSKVYKEHPEWFIQYRDGNPMSVHSMWEYDVTVCMTSGWKDYIKQVILRQVKENGLEYVKLDLGIVTSAYMFDRSRSGCYARGHSHKDREELFLEIYRNTWQLFDELHTEAPDLFIDCTFETMGALQMIDLDMCKYAEGNWLFNFEEPVPRGSIRVRQMSWWRSGVIPATALVVGNQFMDDPNWELSFQSLLGSLPFMLGDPRKVGVEDWRKMRAWSAWID
jgi:alpha-galactosidase